MLIFEVVLSFTWDPLSLSQLALVVNIFDSPNTSLPFIC